MSGRMRQGGVNDVSSVASKMGVVVGLTQARIADIVAVPASV